jgi:putative ABC transport system permease protein
VPTPAQLGLRWIRQRPIAALVSIVCLGLGLGASATAVMLADATVLRPYGLSGATDLVVLWETDADRPRDMIEVSLPTFEDWTARSTSFTSLAAFGSSHWPGIARLHQGSGGAGPGDARAVPEAVAISPRGVSVRFFRTLGVTPLIGRDFAPEDLALNTIAPVILSHAFWMNRFGGDPNVIGRSIFIDNDELRVIGVMPAGFAFPDAPDAWISVERVLQAVAIANKFTRDQTRGFGVLEVVGRLKSGASRSQAMAELNAVEQEIQQQFFPKNKPLTVTMTPFAEVVIGRLGERLWIAVAMTIAVLLFACANVASLRLAQLRERSGELAARLCLGATRTGLFKELLFETAPLMLTATLAAAGIAFALEVWLGQVPIVASSGVTLSQYRDSGWAALLLFAATSWMLVSAAPSLAAVRQTRIIDVHGAGRAIARSSRGARALLTVQAALAVCLVAMAAGAFQAFARLAALDVGFSTSDVTVSDVSFPDWKYESPAERTRVDQQLISVLERVPGVTAAAGVSVRPFRFGEIADGMQLRRPEDVATNPDRTVGASRVIVTPRYFEAMSIAILEGRAFSETDRTAGERHAIVSRGLARTMWGDASAVGKRFESFSLSAGWQPWLIVGVAEDVRSRVIDRPALEVYMPYGRGGLSLSSYVVRHPADRVVTEAMIRTALGEVDPDLAVSRVQTARAVVDRVLAPSRLLSTAMNMLGVTGVILLAVGIFGAAATALRLARREVAIRQAIGATPFMAARAPLGSLLMAIAGGTLIGSVAAPGALRLLTAIGVAESSGLWLALAGAALTVAAAAGVAIAVTVRPAMRASPAELLRTD